MSQEWSRVVSAEVKKEYMTLQGIQTNCSQLTSQNTKTVKSHLSLTLMRVKLVSVIFGDNYKVSVPLGKLITRGFQNTPYY